jgi:hypothetical protein
MSPHHFSKQMNNPYFRTKHFQEESVSAQVEKRLEARIIKVLNAFNPLYWIRKVRRAK